ncbi:MAG TPA: hypothetical protein VMW75_18450, partial [Thermoanaerobaculia bacterium]|nr:hypothetical protein [Thermoanaerobaculia bacterium]
KALPAPPAPPAPQAAEQFSPSPAPPFSYGGSGTPGAAAGAPGTAGTADTITAPSEAPAAPPAEPTLDERPLRAPAAPAARAGSVAQRGQHPQQPAAKAAAPRETPAGEAAAGERAGGAPPQAAAATAAPAPPSAAAAPPSSRVAARVQPAPPPAPAIAAPDFAAPLRSSFGADTGVASYRRLRRGLLDEGRLPRAASMRADELANAFDLGREMPAVGRPELSVEGAPLPAAGAVYLLRFEARGLMGSPGTDAVEVDFDPAVVARFRRVGATASRGSATALYEVELRPAAGHAANAEGAASARGAAAAGVPSSGARPASPRELSGSGQPAAAPPAAGDRPSAASAPLASGDRVIATLRLVNRDRFNVGGNESGHSAGDGMVAGRVLRFSQLRPSWEAASPALRAPGLAVQFAQALAARDPAPRLRRLRVQAQALAAELPGDPKAAELLDLVERAAALAAPPGAPPPHPP